MNNQKGFTLIETVVYIALFAILMGGTVVVAYTVFESAGRNQGKEMIQQEGDFLIGKIEWALSGVQTVDPYILPPDGIPRTCDLTRPICLSVTKYGNTVVNLSLLAASDCPQTDNGYLLLWQGADCPLPLNNSNVQISNLIFTHNYGGGINPESVSASFDLTTIAENGMLINQDFSTTKYLRK